MSKSEFTSIPKKVSQSLKHTFSEGSNFILGISGGPDSMALLYLFHKLQKEAFVVHINYGLRGADSDADQELVEGMASVWGFECCSVRLSSEDISGNFQNWAREQRYQIFQDFKKELDADAIVVAHHQDDQIETVLQKLLRGSGPDKWGGLKEWDGTIYRPLLDFSKDEILRYCKSEAIPFRVDLSNHEEKYARNFLRGSFSERLDELFPGWKTNILGLSIRGKEMEAALEFVLASCRNNQGLDVEMLQQVDAVLLPAVLKRFVEQETDQRLTRGEVQELTGILLLQVGKGIQLTNEWLVIRDREVITVKKGNISKQEVIISREDAINGIEVHQLFIRQDDTTLRSGELSIDFDLLQWPLTLRTRNSGDRFQPLGMKGSQKISDHLVNRKVNASEKQESLILTGADGTIYALFYPTSNSEGQKGSISELVKVTEKTTSTLTITL